MPVAAAVRRWRGELMVRRVLFIGRGRDNDVRLAEPTVSRRHAELVVTEDGRYHLTDCASAHGTQVLRDGQWKAVRQAFVVEDDELRFGEHRTGLQELLAQASRDAGGTLRLAGEGRWSGRPSPSTHPTIRDFSIWEH